MRFRIGAVECDRLARQRFGRSIRFSLTARLGYGGRLDVSRSEALVAASEGGIDIDGLPKVLLCESVIVPTEFEDMPQAALVGGAGIEAGRSR
jgi:hypothetical protein